MADRAKTAPVAVASVHVWDELVYHEGESPAWIMTSYLGGQHSSVPNLAVLPAAYMPLTLLHHDAAPDDLYEVRRRVTQRPRDDLIKRYWTAFTGGKRLIAGIMAAELIERGVPPCFWHEVAIPHEPTLDQCADLVLTDLAWLRRWYPEHAKAVRYHRGKALLTGSEATFRREAKFAFYQGKRPAWKLVSSMSMTERQQWDCTYLRSTPVKRLADATEALSCRVRKILANDLQAVRRTAIFTDLDAQASLERRHALWRCARMVKAMRPTEIAERYQQMTGMTITRQAVAKQLEKVRLALRAQGVDFKG